MGKARGVGVLGCGGSVVGHGAAGKPRGWVGEGAEAVLGRGRRLRRFSAGVGVYLMGGGISPLGRAFGEGSWRGEPVAGWGGAQMRWGSRW
jgi:hypothetical protein